MCEESEDGQGGWKLAGHSKQEARRDRNPIEPQNYVTVRTSHICLCIEWSQAQSKEATVVMSRAMNMCT